MTETKQARYEAMEAEHKALVDQFLALKQERVKARLEGTEFTREEEIARLDHEITVMGEVVIELADQAREESRRASAADQAAAWAASLDAVSAAETDYVDAVAQAEKVMADLVKCLLKAGDASETLAQFTPKVPGQTDFTTVGRKNSAMRLSERMFRAMRPLAVSLGSDGGIYGRLVWGMEQERSEDWAAEERDLVERELAYPRRTVAEKIAELNSIAAE